MRKHILTLVLAIFCLGALAQSPCTITQLPYACRLDTVPECWSGDNPQHIYGTATSPEIDPSIPISQLTLRLKLHTMPSVNWTVALYVGFKDSVGGAFIPYDTLFCNSHSFDREFEVSFAQYAGTARHLCFQVEHFQSIYMSDLVLDYTPTCGNPLIVQLDSVSGTWASLSWQPRQGESSWQYAYNYAGDGPVQWVQTSTPHVLLQGLDPVTEYGFFLQAECSPVDAGPMPIFPVRTVSTTCPDALALPYGEDFANPLMEDCWNGMDFMSNQTGQLYEDFVVMPPVPSNTQVSDLMLKFEYQSVLRDLVVGVMTDPSDSSTFQPIDTIPNNDVNVWHYTEVLLQNYSGMGRYIAFKGSSWILDNIVLQEIPSCVYPFPIVTSNTASTSTELSFTVRGDESQWEIAYGPSGFYPDNGGTHFTIGYSTSTLSGLVPQTDYDVYVRSLCYGVQGGWSVKHTFTTQCPPITQLPYAENFDTYCSESDTCFPDCWSRFGIPSILSPHIVDTSSVSSNYPFSAPNALKIAGGNSSNSIVMLPAISSSFNMQGLQVSFNLLDIYSNCQLQVGVMEDPSDESSFVSVATVHSAVNSIPLQSYTGNGRCIAIRNVGYSAAYIDDVTIEPAPPCGTPGNLTVSDILGTSAIVSWDPVASGTEDVYIVYYRPMGGNHLDSIIVTGHQTPLPGLLPDMDYEVLVRCLCQEGYGNHAAEYFHTYCETAQQTPFGNGTDLFAHLPFNTGTRSYSQQLYTADELGLANVPNDISALQFQYQILYPDASSDHRQYVEFYMGNTSQVSFPSSNSWIPINSMQLVFADTIQLQVSDSLQWMTLNLSTPFHYAGNGSIVIAALKNDIDNDGSRFAVELTQEYKSLYAVRSFDDEYLNPLGTINDGINDSRYRSNVRFVGCDSTAGCATPNLSLIGLTGSDAELEIIPGGTESSWQIEYRKDDDSTWTFFDVVSSNTPIVTGLDLSSDYLVRTRAVCDGGGVSPWSSVFVSTECGAIEHFPFTEDFSDFPNPFSYEIPNCWGEIEFWNNAVNARDEVLYIDHGAAILPPVSDTIDISNLMLTLDVEGYVRVGVMDNVFDTTTFIQADVLSSSESQLFEIPFAALSAQVSTEKYVALISHNSYALLDNIILDKMPSCIHPDNVVLDTAFGTTATISWNERGTATQWNIEYGPRGFVPGTGSGIIVSAASNPFTITGLPNSQYLDFYVQSDCGSGDVSRWSRDCCSYSTPACDSTEQCAIQLILMDGESFTAGWSNLRLDMFINGIFQRQFYLETSSPDTLSVPVCDSATIAFKASYVGISANQEIMISIYDSYGDVVAENLSNVQAWNSSIADFDTLISFFNVCNDNSCLAPRNIFVDSISPHNALLAWTALNGESSWMVEYKPSSDHVWLSAIAYSNPYNLQNLADETSYDVRVAAICDDGSYSGYRDTLTFITPCGGVFQHTVSSGTQYATNIPDEAKKYYYTQEIYTASELQGIEEISSFDLLNNEYYSEYVWDVYLGHTSRNNFTGNHDWIDPESLTLMFSGTIHDYNQVPNHWVTFQLDSTFHYNGTDNLVLAVYNHIGVNRFNSEKWMTYMTGTMQNPIYQTYSLYSWQNAAFDISNAGFSQSDMRSDVNMVKNVIRFPKCCATPYGVFVQPNATDTTATVTWQPGGGESRWVLEYKLNSATEWTSVVCNQPSYLIADVTPSVQYMGRVMAVCDTLNDEGSGWVDFTFSVVPAAPTAYNIVSSAGPGGTILPTGNVNVMAGYDMTFDIVPDTAAGYVIQDVLVDEVSQGPVPTYTFYAVDADHTIRAEFLNVGIDDFPEENLVLYPNPTNGKLRIENGELTIDGVEVYDVYGKLLQTVTVNDVAADLDVTHLPAGLYFARIRTDNGVVTKRFVKR